MALINKRKLFYLLGAGIVAFWLVMVALLIRKTHFHEVDQVAGTPIQAELESVERFQHDWMEIYLKGKKVGFSETKVSPLGGDQLIQEKMVLALNLMGQPSVVRMTTRAVVDKGFLLKRFRLVIDSGVVRFRVSGKVEENRMVVEVGEGDRKRDHLIPLAGPLTIGAGLPGFFKGCALGIGDAFRFTFFDPSILSHKEMLIKVTGKTVISVDGREYPAFRLETEVWGQTLVFWLDEEGVLLKEEGFMGLTLVRSDKDRAPFDVEGSAGVDFYDAAAIPVKQTLKRPREINYLKVKVAGLQGTGFNLSVLNEGRQKLRKNMLEIHQESLPSSALSKRLKADMAPHMKPFMLPGINIQSDDRALVEKIGEIVGSETDRRVVARKLMGWVYENVEKRPVVSVPDALAVLETRVGDCNEHAVLLTALLRAAGIPARECVGIVYTDHRFFYHAWTEAYLGHWISMDATLNQMPTDATHIKLVHGGLEKQAELMALMGKLQMDVVDYTYDSVDQSFQKVQNTPGR
jgi:hypothetical protein